MPRKPHYNKPQNKKKPFHPARQKRQPVPYQDWTSSILFEDNHVLVLNKPFCVPVQGDKTGDPSLDHLLRQYLQVRESKPGDAYLVPVHRIDRPASGVLLFAKTSKAAGRLSDQFRHGQTRKEYLIWVEPRSQNTEQVEQPLSLEKNPSGELHDHIGKRPHGSAYIATKDQIGEKNVKEANLQYSTVKFGKKTRLSSRRFGDRPPSPNSHSICITWLERCWRRALWCQASTQQQINSLARRTTDLRAPHPKKTNHHRSPYAPYLARMGPKDRSVA